MCHLQLDGHATFWSCCSSWTDIFHHLQLTAKSRNDLNMLVCRTRDHKNSNWCWSEPMNAIRISAFISTLVGFLPYVEEAVVKFSTKARWEIRTQKGAVSMEITLQILPCSVVPCSVPHWKVLSMCKLGVHFQMGYSTY